MSLFLSDQSFTCLAVSLQYLQQVSLIDISDLLQLKGLSVIVHSKRHFFSKPPEFFAYSERELHYD